LKNSFSIINLTWFLDVKTIKVAQLTGLPA